MASSDHIKALFKAFAKGDEAQFNSVAMQIAANEAKAGHGKLAEELRTIIDEVKVRTPPATPSPIPLANPRGEVADLLTVSYPSVRLADMVLSVNTRRTLDRVKKLLLLGPPGTGKTLAASAISGELALPLFVVSLTN
jgi:Cdc6-like AAA superfamily ATPase